MIENILKYLYACYPGYKKVPEKPLLVHPISDRVVYFNYSEGSKISSSPLNIMKGEYKSISLNGYGIHIHRLKGMAFIEPPKGYNFDQLTINHKNGDKQDNKIENLEWVTYQDNLLHAFENGLRNDNKPCFVRDVITGKIYSCYSRNKAKELMGNPNVYVQNYIISKKLISFRYEVADNKKDFLLIAKEDIWKYCRYNPINVFDIITGKEFNLSRWEILFKYLKVDHSLLKKPKMVPGEVYEILNRYEVKLITEYNDMIDAFNNCPFKPTKRKVKVEINKSASVEVIFPDKSIKVFESLHEVAKALNVSYGAIQKRMSKYKGHWKGYQLRYLPVP